MEVLHLNDSSSGELSPEDFSWVNSCLLEDADITENNWDSLKDAFMDIISAQAGMTSGYAFISEDDKSGSGSEITSGKTRETADPSKPMNDDECFFIDEVPGPSEDEIAGGESRGAVPQSISDVNPFQPTYSEDINEGDLGFDSCPSSYGFDPRSHDIFRVWELDTQSEVDELIKRFTKTLSESLSESTPTHDPEEWNGLKDVQGGSLNELIGGIAEMSLSHD